MERYPWSWFRNFNIVKMSILPKAVCRCNAFSIKIPVAFFAEIGKKILKYIQFSSAAQSCPTLCDPMVCSTPGFPVHYQLPEPTQIHVHWVWFHPTISSSVVLFSSCFRSFPASGSFPMSWFFEWGGQSIGVSASASVLRVSIQDWFSLGWTGWISLQS